MYESKEKSAGEESRRSLLKLPDYVLRQIFNHCDNPVTFLQVCIHLRDMIGVYEVKKWVGSKNTNISFMSMLNDGECDNTFRLIYRYKLIPNTLYNSEYTKFCMTGQTQNLNSRHCVKLKKQAARGILSPMKRITLLSQFLDIYYLKNCTYASFIKAERMWENVEKSIVMAIFLKLRGNNSSLLIRSFVGELVFKLYGKDAIQYIYQHYTPCQVFKYAAPILIAGILLPDTRNSIIKNPVYSKYINDILDLYRLDRLAEDLKPLQLSFIKKCA